MKIVELNDFSRSLSKVLELGVPFKIVKRGDEYSFHTLTEKEYPKQLNSVVEFAKDFHHEISIRDFYRLPKEEMDGIVSVDKLLKEFIFRHDQTHPIDEVNKKFDLLKKYSFSISLGAKIPVERVGDIDKEFVQIIRANRLDRLALPLRIQFQHSWEKGLLFPVEIEGLVFQNLARDQLKKVEIRNNREKIVGFRFYHHDRFVFDTDKNYKLGENYSFVLGGIAQYHVTKAFPLYPTLKRMPSKRKRKNSIEVKIFHGRVKKLALILKKEDGYIYSVGVAAQRIICPDPSFLEEDKDIKVDTYKIPVSKEELRAVKQELEDKRFRLSRERSDVDLLSVLDKCLKIRLIHLRPLVTRNWFLSYLTLPVAIFRLYTYKRMTTLPRMTKVIFRPFKRYSLNYRRVINSLVELPEDRIKRKKVAKKSKRKKA